MIEYLKLLLSKISCCHTWEIKHITKYTTIKYYLYVLSVVK